MMNPSMLGQFPGQMQQPGMQMPQQQGPDFSRISQALGLGKNFLSQLQPFSLLQGMGGTGQKPQGPQQQAAMPPPSDPMNGFSPAVMPQNPALMNPMQFMGQQAPMSQTQPMSPDMLQFLMQIFSQQPGQMNMPQMGSPPPSLNQTTNSRQQNPGGYR